MQKVKRKNEEINSSSPSKKSKQNDHQPASAESKKCMQPFKKKPVNNKNGKSIQFKGKVKPKFNSATNLNKDGEKPKWSEMKKEKRELRLARRKAKATVEVFEISHKAKLLAAQIQRKVVKQDFRLNSCKELHNILRGQYKSIALTHDLSRVIQVLLKYAQEDIRKEITEEVLDIIVPMVQSKYAQHAVKRILKYGTDKIRHDIIKRFYGHIVSLAAHTISAPVLDYAYGEFANNKEKLHMQQEFYGEIYKNTKDNKLKTLKDAYKDSPEMKAAILQSCKANIKRILDKNLHDSELLHSVLYDYIQECSPEERNELISTLSPLIVPLSNSLPGVNAASVCVWQGTNKDKKTILKVVKEHVIPLTKHKTGYRLLLAIFDSVDDTVFVKKVIVSTLTTNLRDIVKDHWGIMTLHWLVKPKDTAIFHPSLIKFLEEGAKAGTSKKDMDIRVSELREAILPAIKSDIENNPEFWVSEKAVMLLTVAVLSVDSSKEIFDAIAKVICSPDWKINANGQQIFAVEDAGIHMCLKKLVLLDKDKKGATFGEAIAKYLDDQTIKIWMSTNRGCFFILKLIENNQSNTVNKISQKIKCNLSILKQQSNEGSKLLLQHVK
ncbi:hypothetical protein ACJJTC_003890 [Scirpophaga incertulas]